MAGGAEDDYERWLAEVTVGGPQRLAGPVELCDYDPAWVAAYERAAEQVRAALGPRALLLEHVGSTSVPGLPAKPIIDIVLEVSDPADEPAYAADLECSGYRLRIREPGWFEHRMFRGDEGSVNLHVFGAGCEETRRMIAFRNRLRTSPADRDLYAETKRALAAREWTYMQQYADAKSEVVAAILERAPDSVTR